MQESIEIWFATSNQHKFEEAKMVLRQYPVSLRRLPAKGVEIQSDDLAEIARRAAVDAFAASRKPLFVEDTGLFVASLKGFPGPYAAYVNRTVGPGSLLALMRGMNRREAEFVTALAFCNSPAGVHLFTGRLEGEISEEPRGTGGFGFDPVFVPKGSRMTLAEMSMEEKVVVSHRSIALRAFGKWLETSNAGNVYQPNTKDSAD